MLSFQPLVLRISNGNAIIYSVNCHCDMQIQPFTSEGPRVHWV